MGLMNNNHTNTDKQKERSLVLEFIANNAAKKDFTSWLNANYDQQFSEEADWDKIRSEVRTNEAIKTTALHNYAGTLTDQEDVNKLLKEVEKETEKAEETVSKMYDIANNHRLRPVVGGACILGGFLLLVAAAGLITGFTDLVTAPEIRNYIAALGLVYGLLTVFAGILLILE